MGDQKAVVVSELESFLLLGDPEAEDDRFVRTEESGGAAVVRGIALPVLLEEGWKISSVAQMGSKVLVILKRGDNGDGKKGD